MPHSFYRLPIDVAATAAVHVGRAMTNRPVYVPDFILKARESICRQNRCGFFDEKELRCHSCRCWMNTPRVGKWRLAGAKCPEGLWGTYDT